MFKVEDAGLSVCSHGFTRFHVSTMRFGNVASSSRGRSEALGLGSFRV